MYGCYVFESRHGAPPNAVLHLRLLGSPASNGLARLHKLSFEALPICSGTLVGTRLPIGGTTLAALGEVAETGRWDLR